MKNSIFPKNEKHKQARATFPPNAAGQQQNITRLFLIRATKFPAIFPRPLPRWPRSPPLIFHLIFLSRNGRVMRRYTFSLSRGVIFASPPPVFRPMDSIFLIFLFAFGWPIMRGHVSRSVALTFRKSLGTVAVGSRGNLCLNFNGGVEIRNLPLGKIGTCAFFGVISRTYRCNVGLRLYIMFAVCVFVLIL